jgi:hypothetical protein
MTAIKTRRNKFQKNRNLKCDKYITIFFSRKQLQKYFNSEFKNRERLPKLKCKQLPKKLLISTKLLFTKMVKFRISEI